MSDKNESWTTGDRKKKLFNQVVSGISSMTLLTVLLLFSLFLFPRLVLCLIAVLTVSMLFRYLLVYRQSPQNKP